MTTSRQPHPIDPAAAARNSAAAHTADADTADNPTARRELQHRERRDHHERAHGPHYYTVHAGAAGPDRPGSPSSSSSNHRDLHLRHAKQSPDDSIPRYSAYPVAHPPSAADRDYHTLHRRYASEDTRAHSREPLAGLAANPIHSTMDRGGRDREREYEQQQPRGDSRNEERYPPPPPPHSHHHLHAGRSSSTVAPEPGPSRARYDHYDYAPHEQSSPPPSWAPGSGSSSGSSSRYPGPPPLHHQPPQYSYPASYPYTSQHALPPPPHHAAAHTDVPPGWGGWGGTPAYAGAPYPTSGPQAAPPPSSRMHPTAQPAQPSPPPPASPSQIQQRLPPPPASAPSPPPSGTPTPGGYLPGFQPDYERGRAVGQTQTRRPAAPDELGGNGGAVAVMGSEVRPPPTEAYLILRPHNVPRVGWQSTADAAQAFDASDWSFELNVLQHPERGKALGVENLRRGWPPLTPPLIIQLVVKDQDGHPVPTDNATLARRLVHMTMSVELVAPDTSESRALMRVRPSSRASSPSGPAHPTSVRGNAQPYYPSSAPPPYSVQKTLLGSSVRTAQVLTRDSRKGLYFIFQDMIVRPEGRYALEGKILDLAGPPHVGTSIGVTHPLAHCRTNPFDVIIPQEYPGPVSITPLSEEFLRQGERHLGRRPRNDDGDSDPDDNTTQAE